MSRSMHFDPRGCTFFEPLLTFIVTSASATATATQAL
jgi:hypothetical protein